MQFRVDIRTKDTHAVNDLLGEHPAMLYNALTSLVIQITGHNDKFMSVFEQILSHFEMASMPRFIRRNKCLMEQ